MDYEHRMQKARMLMESNQALLKSARIKEQPPSSVKEGFTRLKMFIALAWWAAVFAVPAYLIYDYGRQGSALDRPLATVSFNELVGSASQGFLYGISSGLLGLIALWIFWRGLRKFWCDFQEVEW